MYSNHHQAESTGFAIGRRQGHEAGRQIGRQEGYNQGWNDAMAEAQATIDELQCSLNGMYLMLYPALATIHHANNSAFRNFFIKHYINEVNANLNTIRHTPHLDPKVAQYGVGIDETIARWLAEAPQQQHRNDSPEP